MTCRLISSRLTVGVREPLVLGHVPSTDRFKQAYKDSIHVSSTDCALQENSGCIRCIFHCQIEKEIWSPTILWQPIHRFSHCSSRDNKRGSPSLLNVTICCFSLSLLTVNEESLFCLLLFSGFLYDSELNIFWSRMSFHHFLTIYRPNNKQIKHSSDESTEIVSWAVR